MAETIRINPTLAGLLRPLGADELAGLEADLLRDGCIDPIIVWDGVLVDGHHRYRICQKHGIPFHTREMDFGSLGDACLWAWNHQNHRRNSSPYDRIERLLACKKLVASIKAKARENQQAAGGAVPQKSAEPVETRQELARLADVSHDTLAKAKFITTHADEQAKDRLRRGKTTIHAEYKRAKTAEKAAARKEQVARLAQQAKHDGPQFRLAVAEIANAADHVEPGTVDWIVTDPPYPKKHLDTFEHLSRFAAHALRPGGSALVMSGQTYLPDVIAKLATHLSYWWTVAYLTPGGQAVQLWPRKVNTFWKPVLWFVKGSYDGDWIGDVARSAVNDNDKRFHDWGQSESGMADLIERFTLPGEVICDPFVGGGTTGDVAVRLGRRFIGLDSDPAAIQTTAGRLAECQR